MVVTERMLDRGTMSSEDVYNLDAGASREVLGVVIDLSMRCLIQSERWW